MLGWARWRALSARGSAGVAQLVERILGKDEVRGSIPRASLLEGYGLFAMGYGLLHEHCSSSRAALVLVAAHSP